MDEHIEKGLANIKKKKIYFTPPTTSHYYIFWQQQLLCKRLRHITSKMMAVHRALPPSPTLACGPASCMGASRPISFWAPHMLARHDISTVPLSARRQG
jgi:hypothetical protein